MPTATAAVPQSRALTIVERVEQSPAVMMLDARGQALVDLLPDAAAAQRFRRVVIQALIKNPELLECTPDSVVLSVFEAAAQGLEPTGAAGGAHLVPYNVKVAKNPDRWEKRAQLIPDYRGVVRLVTKGTSDVQSIEARVVKEGDEFEYADGTDAWIRHTPSLAPGRSARPTTHVYAIARFKSGATKQDVEDRAGIEKIETRARGGGFSPWTTDWDEMAKKTMVKRLAKLLPVAPEVRSILMRGDDRGDADDLQAGPALPAGPTKAARLASRLGGAQVVPAPTEPVAQADPPAEAPTGFAAPPAEDVDLATALRSTAEGSAITGQAPPEAVLAVLNGVFAEWDRDLVTGGIRILWGDVAVNRPTAAQVKALELVGGSMAPEAFAEQWRVLVEGAVVEAQG